jgi:hypothetical protein
VGTERARSCVRSNKTRLRAMFRMCGCSALMLACCTEVNLHAKLDVLAAHMCMCQQSGALGWAQMAIRVSLCLHSAHGRTTRIQISPFGHRWNGAVSLQTECLCF